MTYQERGFMCVWVCVCVCVCVEKKMLTVIMIIKLVLTTQDFSEYLPIRLVANGCASVIRK